MGKANRARNASRNNGNSALAVKYQDHTDTFRRRISLKTEVRTVRPRKSLLRCENILIPAYVLHVNKLLCPRSLLSLFVLEALSHETWRYGGVSVMLLAVLAQSLLTDFMAQMPCWHRL